MLGIEAGSSARAAVLSMAEPSLQPSVDSSVAPSPGSSKHLMSTRSLYLDEVTHQAESFLGQGPSLTDGWIPGPSKTLSVFSEQ